MKMKMMWWPPWQPLPSKKFEVIVLIHRVEGVDLGRFMGEDESSTGAIRRRPVVEIKWKGQRTVALRRSVARNFTEEGGCRGDGVVEWNEEFKRLCGFSFYREGFFLPWDVAFTVFHGLNHGSKDKVPVLGTALLNIAESINSAIEEDVRVKIPLMIPGANLESSPTLLLSLRFTAQESSAERQRSVVPVLWSPCSAEDFSNEKAESSLKAGLRKMKTFKNCMSTGGTKNDSRGDETSDGQSPDRNPDTESNYPFDTDSLEDDAEEDSEESKGEINGVELVNYETLTYANWIRGSLHFPSSPEDDNLIYYSHRRSDAGPSTAMNSNALSGSEQSSQETSKKRMLSWRKRKLSFRSPKHKGEPLLKKDCREEGGDDIDFDRRLLSLSDESISEWYKSEGSILKQSSDSEFGDDSFVVGSWESRGVLSRDGLMKLKAQVFFASIDQRSERAAGESACTALVAVLADWLQTNKHIMPTRSEFDSLIREGSLQWRNLCENSEYKERFPDKHFDLDTVLNAKIRPICVVPEKSFIGFFHPEEYDEEEKEENCFDFLSGVMSFDSIWEEISMKQEPDSLTKNNDPVIYIVSWNDHFFVLLIDHDAYYIIDTLGERLFEGCDQAYVLKFDKDTEIQRSSAKDSSDSDNAKPSNERTGSKNEKMDVKNGETDDKNKTEASTERIAEKNEQEVVSRGKDSCKEYIRRFLAAIPIRQLKADMKKGMVASVHHRLQIEFHYTKRLFRPLVQCPVQEEEAAAAIANDVCAASSSLVVA